MDGADHVQTTTYKTLLAQIPFFNLIKNLEAVELSVVGLECFSTICSALCATPCDLLTAFSYV